MLPSSPEIQQYVSIQAPSDPMAFGFIDIGIPASSGLYRTYVGNCPSGYDDIIVSTLLGWVVLKNHLLA